MLKKGSRLGRNKEFEMVFKKGRAAYGKLMSVRLLSNNLGYNRFGVLAGTKISKSAVTRNKIRRRVKGSISAKFLFFKKGFDIVVVVFPDIIKVDYQKIDSELSFLLKRLGVLDEK